jgi:hypothetical protein
MIARETSVFRRAYIFILIATERILRRYHNSGQSVLRPRIALNMGDRSWHRRGP